MPSVCWYMTEKCNLKCDYCYAFKNNKHPAQNELITTGKHIREQGVNEINLTGGEPLTNKATYDVIDAFGDHMNISLTTNGTIFPIDKPSKDILKKLKRVCVSIDATTNNYFESMRGKNVNNLVLRILENVEKFIDLDITVEINTVVNKKNISHLPSIANYISEHWKYIKWRIFDIAENENVDPESTKYKLSINEYNNLISNLKMSFPRLDIQAMTEDNLNNNYLIIDCYGNFSIPGYNKYKNIGNVKYEKISDKLKTIPVFSNLAAHISI